MIHHTTEHGQRARSRLFLEGLEERHLLTAFAFEPLQAYPVGINPTGVASADLNGDGNADLAVANWGLASPAGDLSVLFGNGDGTFGHEVRYLRGSGNRRCSDVVPIDLNGDEAIDLLVTNCDGRDVSVLLNNGDGTFGEPTDYAPGTTCPQKLAVADLNGDSHVDVAIATGNGIKTMMGNGDGTFAAAQQHNVGNKVFDIATADMNADGYPEILLIDSGWGHNTLFVLPNQGNGEFGDPVSYSVTTDLFGMAVGDLDGDGNVDAVATGHAVSVLLGHGDGTLEEAVDYEVPSNPSVPDSESSSNPILGDWNLDGYVDLAVTTRFTNKIVLFAGQGDGTFSEPVTVRTSNWPAGITTDDFNGDGLPDLAGASGRTNVVMVFLNAVDPPLVGDFDNDLDVDGDDLSVWQGGFGTTTEANLDDGDADGDGDVDGNDFLNWQLNYSSTASSGVAADSSTASEAADSGGGAFFSTTNAVTGALNDATVDPLGPALTRGNSGNSGQDTPLPPSDRHGYSFDSVDYAGWSLPQPMPKTNGSTSTWLHLPQFQSRGADRPFQRDLAVDTVMSRLDVQNSRVDLNRLHEVASDSAFIRTEYDDIARPVVRGVAKVQIGDALDDRAVLEVALEGLRDAPWQKSKGILAF